MPASPIQRHPKNPILTPEQMPFRCYTVFNAGAVLFRKQVILLLRCETAARETVFHVARSDDGVDFTVDPKPIDYPLHPLEKRFGKAHRFDMRVTKHADGSYYVYHAAWLGKWGCCVALATTKDFVHFKPHTSFSQCSNRNAVMFPEMIGGLYARLDRPQDFNGRGGAWVNYSPDLEFWGRSCPVDLPDTPWNCHKKGPGAVPIRTPKGWLEIYHGTAMTCSTENYYLGAALLDLKDPSKIVAAPREFLLAAETPYECIGQTPNVVFTGGAVVMPDGTLNLYYGGADTRLCLAQTKVDDLVTWCLKTA